MHVEVRKSGDVVIVDLNGKLVGGLGETILHDVVDELLAEGWKKILLNMSGVTHIDSSGVGELVASLRTARNFESSVKLLNLHEHVKKTLHFAALLPVFEVFDRESDAIATFQ
jgi:anti-sigma B factor antagonist